MKTALVLHLFVALSVIACAGDGSESEPDGSSSATASMAVSPTPTLPPTASPTPILHTGDEVFSLMEAGLLETNATAQDVEGDLNIVYLPVIRSWVDNCRADNMPLVKNPTPPEIQHLVPAEQNFPADYLPGDTNYYNVILGQCEHVGEASRRLYEATHNQNFKTANGYMRDIHQHVFDWLYAGAYLPGLNRQDWLVYDGQYLLSD